MVFNSRNHYFFIFTVRFRVWTVSHHVACWWREWRLSWFHFAWIMCIVQIIMGRSHTRRLVIIIKKFVQMCVHVKGLVTLVLQITQIRIRVAFVGQSWLSASSRWQKFPFFAVPPFHSSILKPDFNLKCQIQRRFIICIKVKFPFNLFH